MLIMPLVHRREIKAVRHGRLLHTARAVCFSFLFEHPLQLVHTMLLSKVRVAQTLLRTLLSVPLCEGFSASMVLTRWWLVVTVDVQWADAHTIVDERRRPTV
jgi:hypothetical protein